MMEWACAICGYIHEGEEPPSMCPVCGAPAAKFAEKYEDDALPGGVNEDEDEEEDYYGEFE
jgi:rubredoxin